MAHLKLDTVKKIFFVGIGGIGISAIARMMLKEGKEVMGSDLTENEVVYGLRDAGAVVKIGQGMDLIPPDVDLIVHTIAIEQYDPVFFEALKNQTIPRYSYPEMLERVTEGKYTIAVSGTHGKTTTTAMIGHVLRKANKDPSMIVGSLLVDEKSNFVAGKSELFVVEACEYRRSFLHINPKIVVITNIEEDHLDYYKDLEDIKNAFKELVAKVPHDGYIVCNMTDVTVQDVVRDAKATVINYVDFYYSRELRIPGVHNQVDAAAAGATLSLLQVEKGMADMYLGTFPGTSRRFEYKGEMESGTQVYDDYAHHPTEVVATLEAFREIYPQGSKRITVVFQPHLYSRTKLFFKEFSEAFDQADRVLLLPIYAAREENNGTVTSVSLGDAIKRRHIDVEIFADFPSAVHYIETLPVGPDDVLVTMGAGEAYKVGDILLKKE